MVAMVAAGVFVWSRVAEFNNNNLDLEAEDMAPGMPLGSDDRMRRRRVAMMGWHVLFSLCKKRGKWMGGLDRQLVLLNQSIAELVCLV
jgi:hypothetical protein